MFGAKQRRHKTPETRNAYLNTIVDIEGARIRLGVNKKQLCRAARIKQEMYSYLMRRGRQGHALPKDCLDKVLKAIRKLGESKGVKI